MVGEAPLAAGALVARPAVVRDRRRRVARHRPAVDLLPRAVADVADVEVVVPGRKVIRNGLRKPWPTIRFAFASAPAESSSGCPSRRVARVRVDADRACRRGRSGHPRPDVLGAELPPSAVAAAGRPARGRRTGSPAYGRAVFGACRRAGPSPCPIEAGAVTAADVQRRRHCRTRAPPPAWLGNCWHQSLLPLSPISSAAGRVRDVRRHVDRVAIELAADVQPSARGPGRVGARRRSSQRDAVSARRRVRL